MAFSTRERDYLTGQPLARLATVAPDGQPDVVPVSFQLDGDLIWIGGSGESFLRTRKVRNIGAGHAEVALVVDNLVSLSPFIAQGIRIYGRAEPPVERVGLVGLGHYLRVVPTVSWSWNLAGEPVGDTWYPTHRTDH